MDSGQIGGVQIFLPQVDAVGIMLNRQPPIIINKQPGLIALAKGDSGGNVRLHLLVWQIFDA
ncbi:hypothetical protein D3C77_770740 [compost metagenome]